jgi:hypothetical protein
MRLGISAAAGGAMPIYRLLQNCKFEPDESAILVSAFHEIIAALSNPIKPKVPVFLAEEVARKIIAIGHAGERDRAAIVAQVFDEMGVTRNRRLAGPN